MKIYGGAIEENLTTGYGGGVYAKGDVTVSGGTISKNMAERDWAAGGENGGDGGGVYACGSMIVIDSAKIIENIAQRSGGGVYANGGVAVGDSVQIAGNLESDEKASNVYLCSGTKMTTENPLTSNAYIGVTTQTKPTADSPVVFMESVTNIGGLKRIFSDDDAYEVGLKVDNAVLGINILNPAPSARSLVYDGSAQELVNPGACSMNGARIKFALGDEQREIGSWDSKIPKGTDVRTYYVWYKMTGTGAIQFVPRYVTSVIKEPQSSSGGSPGTAAPMLPQEPQQEMPQLPQTGDASSLLSWIALLGASCAGLKARSKR